jgi:peptidoglycan hydrolase-like protein with peptidoglycan-binding domain
VGLVTLIAGLVSVNPANARAKQAGDPDTAHIANPKRMIVTVDRGTHQVHVQGVLDGGVAAASVTGGGGLAGAGTPKVNAKRAKRSKAQAAPQVDLNNPVLAPVAQDGGSAHLGERTLRMGMRGHDVRVLQSYLTVAGYATSIDGDFGSGTKTNVVSFESAHQLTANGVVTYSQSRILRQVVSTALAGGAVSKATINSDGTATAPAGAPAPVQAMIAAANKIVDTPYIYAGGHGRWIDNGYDCSGAVSFALHGAGMLSAPEDSSELESYGAPGPGKWVSIYANPNHTWIVIAGIAFDTAHYGPTTPAGSGPRWLSNATGNLADGQNYVVRHPAGM